MRRFDYSFLEHGMLPARLINVVGAISELRERENQRKDNFGELFAKLEGIARVQSVRGSNAIEGILTSEQRIDEIVNRNSAPLNHNEAEIAGYRNALRLAHEGHARPDISESDILQLHEAMLTYAPGSGGRYRETDVVIMEDDTGATGAGGIPSVRFSPVPASETARAMELLIQAYMDARGNCNISQLLLIPCFILDFLCIHPFEGGNGRMSRLLSLLLLYKNGFDAGRYISFEEQIDRSREEYCQALRESSAGWHMGENSYFPFMEYFAATLLSCYRELDRRFAAVSGKKAMKRLRIETTVLNSLLPISKQEICRILPDVSPTTVEAVLSAMLKAGLITKVGAARSTRYTRN
jgi:Fic family protein